MPKTTEINSEETKKYTQFLQDKANIINLYLELSEVKEYSVLANLLARLEILINLVNNDGMISKDMDLVYNFANMILSKCKLVNFSYDSLIKNYKEFARLFSVINREDIADIDYSWIDAKNKSHVLYPLVNALGKMTILSGPLGQTINIVNAQPIFSNKGGVIVPVFIDTEYLERPIITTLLDDINDDNVWDVNDLQIGVGTYEEFIGDKGLVYQNYTDIEQEYVASEDKYYLRFDLLDLYKTSYNMPWVVSVMDTNNMVRVDYIVYFNIQDSPEPPEPEPIPEEEEENNEPVDPVDPEEDNNEPGNGETGPK